MMSVIILYPQGAAGVGKIKEPRKKNTSLWVKGGQTAKHIKSQKVKITATTFGGGI